MTWLLICFHGDTKTRLFQLQVLYLSIQILNFSNMSLKLSLLTIQNVSHFYEIFHGRLFIALKKIHEILPMELFFNIPAVGNKILKIWPRTCRLWLSRYKTPNLVRKCFWIKNGRNFSKLYYPRVPNNCPPRIIIILLNFQLPQFYSNLPPYPSY